MLLLALDTSGPLGSVAVLQDQQILSEISWQAASQTTTLLPSKIQGALDQSAHSLDEIEAFALAIGPGSFTGLRVGLSLIKGLAFKDHRPVCGISTLEALKAWALEAREGDFICTLLDARKEEIYGALYRREQGRDCRVIEEKVESISTFLYSVNSLYPSSDITPSSLILIGNGVDRHPQEIGKILRGKAITLKENFKEPLAGKIGLLGALQIQKGDYFAGGVDLTPHYLRASDSLRMGV